MKIYNEDNPFAKIISGQIPSEKLVDDEYMIIIKDLYPVAPIHFLAIPKGNYVDFSEFVTKASDAQLTHYYKTIGEFLSKLGITDYRMINNTGSSAGQSVFHFHTHLLAGGTFSNLI
jgi:diadenosine tetraphosphate (Ap4A) HIT family hydrolase